MFPYWGGKSRFAKFYPKPEYDLIIEPFAGSARYSLHYYKKEVIIIDKNSEIIEVWKWLQQASPKDILSLPKLKIGDRIKREDFDCDAQLWFMSLIINTSTKTCARVLTKFASVNYEDNKKRIAKNLYKIRHWKIINGEYSDVKNYKATWYIDPPYIKQGRNLYGRFNAKHIDFEKLGKWCRSRNGQVIVCEYSGADWLPFVPLKNYKVGVRGDSKLYLEAIWTNRKRLQIKTFNFHSNVV